MRCFILSLLLCVCVGEGGGLCLVISEVWDVSVLAPPVTHRATLRGSSHKDRATIFFMFSKGTSLMSKHGLYSRAVECLVWCRLQRWCCEDSWITCYDCPWHHPYTHTHTHTHTGILLEINDLILIHALFFCASQIAELFITEKNCILSPLAVAHPTLLLSMSRQR